MNEGEYFYGVFFSKKKKVSVINNFPLDRNTFLDRNYTIVIFQDGIGDGTVDLTCSKKRCK